MHRHSDWLQPECVYELAIAHSARRPVTMMLEKGRELPFDVQDLRCVAYDLWPTDMIARTYVVALTRQVEEIKAAIGLFRPFPPNSDSYRQTIAAIPLRLIRATCAPLSAYRTLNPLKRSCFSPLCLLSSRTGTPWQTCGLTLSLATMSQRTPSTCRR